jgi:hypothetical protein
MVAVIFMIPLVSCVDHQIILLLRGPLATGLKVLSPGLGSLYAYIYDCEQIGHNHGFFMVISSIVLRSLTPSRKALMISMS